MENSQVEDQDAKLDVHARVFSVLSPALTPALPIKLKLLFGTVISLQILVIISLPRRLFLFSSHNPSPTRDKTPRASAWEALPVVKVKCF